MASTKFLTVKGRLLRISQNKFPNGERLINVNCCDKYCPHKCAHSMKMPAGLWCVPLVQIVEKCFLPCAALEKIATETAKQYGRPSLMSLVKSEVS